MAEIRSVTVKNVQNCLEGMGLDFSKCNQFKAQWERQQQLNILNTVKEV